MSQYPQHPQYPQHQGTPGQWPGPPPGYGGQVPPPAAGRKGKRTGLVVTVVVVVVAVVAGGAWFWLSGGSGGSGGTGGIAAEAETQLSPVLEATFPADWEPDGDEVEMSVGSWVDGRWWTDEHLVREMPDEVVAYDLSDGSVAWQVPVPGNGACHSSREMTPEGYVAILRGDGMGSKAEKGCHQLTLIDTTAGEELWTVELEQLGGKFPSAASYPVILGGSIHVAGEGGGQSRAVADGSLSDRRAQPQGCRAAGYLGVDGVLMAWLRCVSDGENLQVLAGYDENVKPLWGWLPGEGPKLELLSVLSADPLLVVVAPDRGRQDIWRVTPGNGSPADPGEHDVVATSSGEIMQPCVGDSNLTVCEKVVLGDGVVYLRSLPGGNSRRYGIVAVDVETGEERWHARADGEMSLAALSVGEDGRLVAYQAQAGLSEAEDQGYQSPGTVVALDPGSGSLTALAALPLVEPGGQWEFVLENSDLGKDVIDWHDGRLAFLVPDIVVTREGGGGGAGSVASLVYS